MVNIREEIEKAVAEGIRSMSFRATVTTLWGDGAYVTRPGNTSTDGNFYGVLGSYTPTVGDDVIVAYLAGNWIIVGKNVRAV